MFKYIISLTSYAERLPTLSLCLSSIFSQTVCADKVILFLSDTLSDQMLPSDLQALKKRGLHIEYIQDDIGPHSKYFYAMQLFPKDIIITLDDDVIYNDNLIQLLISSYKKYPYAVSAGRVHKISFDENGSLNPYRQWIFEYPVTSVPRLDLFATGVGGVLYPPNCMSKETFHKEAIKKYCLWADDIWLKFMQLLKETPVVLANPGKQHPKSISQLQGNGLVTQNLHNHRNDIYINNMINLTRYNINKLKQI